jgi:histidine triad (HIT) family protein
MDDCIFCKIVSGEIPSERVFENQTVYAFLDTNPMNDGHVLVVPKKHYADLFDIELPVLRDVSGAAQLIAQRMKSALGAKGVNLFNLSGEAAEQSVPHFHLHVVPRYVDDNISISHWWETKAKPADAHKQSVLAEKLRASLTE